MKAKPVSQVSRHHWDVRSHEKEEAKISTSTKNVEEAEVQQHLFKQQQSHEMIRHTKEQQLILLSQLWLSSTTSSAASSVSTCF